jgi:hypothetical protein
MRLLDDLNRATTVYARIASDLQQYAIMCSNVAVHSSSTEPSMGVNCEPPESAATV